MATPIQKTETTTVNNGNVAKVTQLPPKNGLVKPISVIAPIKKESEKTTKMGQVSGGAATNGKDGQNPNRNNGEKVNTGSNNTNSSYRRSNDQLNAISGNDKKSASKEKISDLSKTETASGKTTSQKENVQTIDIRDLQRVFKKPDTTSTPPIPLRKKTGITTNSNRSSVASDIGKKSETKIEIKKSTSTSNVSSYLSKKYQDMKERSNSFRFLSKSTDKPSISQRIFNDTRSLTRSSSQYNRFNNDSVRSSIERSLEILKTPSSKMPTNRITSPSPTRITSPTRIMSPTRLTSPPPSKESVYRYNRGRTADRKLSSSSQVSELWSDLNEEQATSTHVSEMLESEISERMKLQKEVQELQTRCSQIQRKNEHMEMEVMEARTYRPSELNGDLLDDDETSSIYRQKYERLLKELEITKRQMQQQHEEELENQLMIKKASDKKLAEVLEDLEEEKRVSSQWKRKAMKANSEIQDQRLMLEEQMARNAELEKKQRKFDVELSNRQEEIIKEHFLREKVEREKDMIQREKYSLEQELHSTRLDMEMQSEKIMMLNKELEELAGSTSGEEEMTQLKRAKQELERKFKDQEEELEELAGQVQLLEQSKLRLEMSLEKSRQELRRELSVKEEEIEEIRAGAQKKVKNLEAQLETEQEERHQVLKQKHELERKIVELSDQPPPHDPEVERRLRRDLKRTKALLQDAQLMLERVREGQASKSIIRQLKNQLEDAEFAKTAAVKARQGAEMELQDLQSQLEEVTRTKCDVESRSLQLSREKNALQTQLEEMEEELAEVMKKYKAVVQQMSSDQKLLTDQHEQISELEAEKQTLKEQLSELTNKVEQMSGHPDDIHKIHQLEGRIRDLEMRLELEQTTRTRLESQLHRLKEQCERMRQECDTLHNKEVQSQESSRRLQRQLRELREDYSALQQKESEAYQKQHELEMALENTEADLQATRTDLRLACQRIQDLQHALEDDISSETDIPEDSGSESDGSVDVTSIRSHRHYVPIHRRLSSSSGEGSLDTALHLSRTSSFDHDSAFSRWTRRQISLNEVSLH